jgi:hypothetical protein
VSIRRFMVRVPDHGWVDWDEETVREYAYAIQANHQPRRRTWGDGAPTCDSCGEVFPCQPSRWAIKNLPPRLADTDEG